MNAGISRNRNIRWLLLVILYAERIAGATQSGGWLAEDLLRRLLSAEGYPVSLPEFRAYCDYLASVEIGCIESGNTGTKLDPEQRYRLTAKGMRVATREEIAPGVGVSGDE
ncbi:MAG: hypothetical protein AB7P69_03695 [Candidatus Binatia bacterium]